MKVLDLAIAIVIARGIRHTPPAPEPPPLPRAPQVHEPSDWVRALAWASAAAVTVSMVAFVVLVGLLGSSYGLDEPVSPERRAGYVALALPLLWAAGLVLFVTDRSWKGHRMSAHAYHRALAVPRGIFAVYLVVVILAVLSDSSLPEELATAFLAVLSVVAIYELAEHGTTDALHATREQ